MTATVRRLAAAAAVLAILAGLRGTARAGGPGIRLGAVTAAPGATVAVTATLATGGGTVAGTQNDFSVRPPAVSVKRKPNGKPDCAVNPAIDKPAATFAFRPPGCSGEGCTAVRALVFSTENVAPIPDGAALYTCQLQVAPGAPAGTVPLGMSGTILSDPNGVRVCGPAPADRPCTGNAGGAVTVGAAKRTEPARRKRK